MTVLTFNPDADPETSTVDGFMWHGSSANWAAVRAAAGDNVDDDGSVVGGSVLLRLIGSAAAFTQMMRAILLFDVTGIPAGQTIDAVTMRLFVTAEATDADVTHTGYAPSTGVPDSDVDLVTSDYGQSHFGDAALAPPITQAAISTGVYNDWVFNAAGIAVVQAAYDGDKIARLAMRFNDDILDTEPGRTGGINTSITFNQADKGANLPELVVTFSSSGPPPPAVTGVFPDFGLAAGGEAVTVKGTAFTDATDVTFGGTSGTGLVVVNDTTITVTTPAHAIGSVQVRVTTPAGSSPDSPADDFLYLDPVPAFDNTYLAAAHQTSPFLFAWRYDEVAQTVGAKVPDPSTLPTDKASSVHFHPDGTYVAVAVADDDDEGIQVWNFDTDAATFGAKLAAVPPDPPFISLSTNSVRFHPSGDYVAVATGGTPFIAAWNFDKATGTIGSKLTDPSALPTGPASAIAWSNDGLFLAIVYSNSPRLSVYPFDPGSGTFGSPLTPASVPAGGPSAVAWSRADSRVLVSYGTTPFASVYPFSGTALGTPVLPTGTNPPTASGHAILFNGRDEDRIILGQQVGDLEPLSAYTWDGLVFGDRVTAPATMTPDNTFGLAVTEDGKNVATASTGNLVTPFDSIGTYDFTDGVWGATSLPPDALPAGRFGQEVGWWQGVSVIPAITNLDPASGSTVGGTTVIVTGTDFTGATLVTFDGVPGTSLVVVNDTTITVVSPVHVAGSVRVAVTAPGGTSPDTPADDYLYVLSAVDGGALFAFRGRPDLTTFGFRGRAVGPFDFRGSVETLFNVRGRED